MRREYTREERLHRAARRVAMHIRGMWQEKGNSDTRLLNPPLIPDDLVIVGRSVAIGATYREHVVPRRVIVEACHSMLENSDSEATVEEMAAFILQHLKIVYVTPDEAVRLNGPGVRQHMPDGWSAGGDIFTRLELAGVVWTAIPETADLAVTAPVD
ncbi:hypothetical protein [Brevundimonas sp. SH203]|uniref:hypothetical protein n=1 Tax=Brevundimonas sp. SH203 TaxID=345167 RepID=UPI0011783F87|nr:hypothetical protein [Brevundimonas sp. SH203]